MNRKAKQIKALDNLANHTILSIDSSPVVIAFPSQPQATDSPGLPRVNPGRFLFKKGETTQINQSK